MPRVLNATMPLGGCVLRGFLFRISCALLYWKCIAFGRMHASRSQCHNVSGRMCAAGIFSHFMCIVVLEMHCLWKDTCLTFSVPQSLWEVVCWGVVFEFHVPGYSSTTCSLKDAKVTGEEIPFRYDLKCSAFGRLHTRHNTSWNCLLPNARNDECASYFVREWLIACRLTIRQRVFVILLMHAHGRWP